MGGGVGMGVSVGVGMGVSVGVGVGEEGVVWMKPSTHFIRRISKAKLS